MAILGFLWRSMHHGGPSAAAPQPNVKDAFSPRRSQRGRAATKENGNFHHEGHEGKEIRQNFVPNFVIFVSFVVICKFSQSARIFKYSNTKCHEEAS